LSNVCDFECITEVLGSGEKRAEASSSADFSFIRINVSSCQRHFAFPFVQNKKQWKEQSMTVVACGLRRRMTTMMNASESQR
jgi:hypothetical protein